MPAKKLYEEVGGFDAILALCRRWHALCLKDPLAAHPFEHQLHPNHDERLAAYFSEAWGGPALYTAGYGDESYVQRIHSGNGIHEDLDEACSKLFEQAVSEMNVPKEAADRMTSYFRRATEGMRPYGAVDVEVPSDLPFIYS